MRRFRLASAVLSPAALFIASCSSAQTGDNPPASARPESTVGPFAVETKGTFNEPWAIRFEPGTQRIFVTEKAGTMKFVDLADGRQGSVTGIPQVAYGGQGGFQDLAFAPDYASSHAIYLSWAEPGEGGNRGGAVGRGTLVCQSGGDCQVDNLQVIWRQVPKTPGPLQFALRLAFSPDGKYLFVASGDRVAIDNVQVLTSNLGKIVRLLPDGKPAPGNPFASQGSPANEVWTLGHRNPLGLRFDASGQLWDLEHGPRGGDELNRLEPGKNYGWPLVSNGDNYNGTPIPDNDTRPDLAQPAISWNPVIAPGDFTFYSGKLWPEWKGQALIAGLATMSIVRVSISGDKGTEEARYKFDKRLRDVVEAPDGSLYVIEDGQGGRLLHLTKG